jgi:hypothetical protein
MLLIFLLLTWLHAYGADNPKRKTDFISARDLYALKQATQAKNAQYPTQAELDALCEGIDFGSDKDMSIVASKIVNLTQAEIDDLCRDIDFSS